MQANSKGEEPGEEIDAKTLAMIQDRIEQLNAFFVQGVANGRGMTVEQVKQLADGRVHLGESAIALKLADRIGSFEQVISDLQKPQGSKSQMTSINKVNKVVTTSADATGDFWAAVDEKAKTMTRTKAISRVRKENPRLHAAMLAEANA